MAGLTPIFIAMVFIFGAIIGSFLNVVILRLPIDEKLGGRSHCPFCRHVLSAPDLVPLLSFLFLAGKCRHCGHKISPRYFIIEFLAGALFVGCYLFLNPAGTLGCLLLLKDFIIVSALLVVFVVDLEHYLILDSVIFPCAAAVGILNFAINFISRQPVLSWRGIFLGSLIAAIVAALPFFLIWYFSKGQWMGFGDVKLALFLGLAFGLPAVFVALMLGILSGGLVSALLLVFTKNTLKSRLPFGTFLSFGAILCLFYGNALLHWYLSFLGF